MNGLGRKLDECGCPSTIRCSTSITVAMAGTDVDIRVRYRSPSEMEFLKCAWVLHCRIPSQIINVVSFGMAGH